MPDRPEKLQHDDSARASLGLALRALRRRDFDDAVRHARRAAGLAADDPTANLVLARALARSGRIGRAPEILARAEALAASDFKIQYRIARYLLSIRPAAAVGAFERALAASPDNGPAHVGLAAALIATRNFPVAARAARRARELMPGSASAAGQLGIALARLGRHEEAIGFLDEATGRLPNWSEAMLQFGHALVALKRHHGAIAYLHRVVELTPNRLDARTALVHALAAAGRFDEAGLAIEAAVSHGLGRDLASELRADCDAMRRVRDTSLVPVSTAFAAQSIDLSSAPPLAAAALAHLRVVWALVLRELRTRFGRHRLGYIWALIEPMLHVATLTLVFTLIDRRAPHGMTVMTLLITGIVPWLAFQSTYGRVQPAVSANRPLLYFRQVTPLALIIARALLELATKFVVFVLLLFVLDAADQPIALPDPGSIIGAMLGMWLCGLGLGMFFAPVTNLFPTLDRAVSLLLRGLYFMSGVFFVIRELHPILRPYVIYNPLLHFIESLRGGFFAQYETAQIDLVYAWGCAIAALFFGLVAERALRRQVMR